MHEFDIIKKYFLRLSLKNKSALKLNDDVFFDKSKKLVVTVDTYEKGVHFINFEKPELVIKKILRSSLSDIICKGVKPKYYFISASGNNVAFSNTNLLKISKSLSEEQKKFDICLCGGDTTRSKKLSFTIICVGFAKEIILRNNTKLNDDIYVTGNLGDSFIGLKILKKKIKLNNKLKKYFEKKYFLPNLQVNLIKKLKKFANSSIDLSDGLIADLEKLINKQNFSYIIYLDKIPISKNLKEIIVKKGLKKLSCISNGDDYQILFTASPSKFRIVRQISKSLGIKISKIGKICKSSLKPQIINQKGAKISLKSKGYYHKF